MGGDKVISYGSHCALLTLVDRHSKYTIIRKVGRKTSENLSTVIIKSLKKEGLPVHTITFDNGSEFAGHQKISKKLKTGIYFARPYKSSDRGLNEHSNGLISEGVIPRRLRRRKFDVFKSAQFLLLAAGLFIPTVPSEKIRF